MSRPIDPFDRLASLIGDVVAQAVRDAGAAGVVVLDDGSPEARLAIRCCTATLGPERIWPLPPPDATTARSLWHQATSAVDRPATAGGIDDLEAQEPVALEEAHRFFARRAAHAHAALTAHPANKTALLLGERIPPEDLLPIGDLYATEVQAISGDCTFPPRVGAIAEQAGGLARLDEALAALIDERRDLEDAMAGLTEIARSLVLDALAAGRAARRRAGIVPKIGARTIGIDLIL